VVATPAKSGPKENLQQKLKRTVSNLEQGIKKRTTRYVKGLFTWKIIYLTYDQGCQMDFF
jgi:hypothetical protein